MMSPALERPSRLPETSFRPLIERLHAMQLKAGIYTDSSVLRPALAGWGGPRADSTPYNNELRIRGTPYSSGIGALANSRLQIKTDADFKRFSAQVGLDDSSRERATKIRFDVYGDERLLMQSPELGFGDAAFFLTVDV